MALEPLNESQGKPLRHRAKTEGEIFGRLIDESVDSLENARAQKFAVTDLESLQARIFLTPMHPMLELRYYIETEQSSDFYSIAYDHIFARKSGLYFMGEHRVGKTRAILNAIDRLFEDMPSIAVFYHTAERQLRQTKASFCYDLLKSFKSFASSKTNSVDRLPRFLITEAVKAGSRTCVIFIDEAQMLTVMQMRYLLEVWNQLAKEGFVLVTVLVGQKGLDSLKQLTNEEDQKAVVARFFAKGCSIGGLHSIDQLRNYLAAFDDKLVYPPNSQWTYSRFFCKQAYDNGWRLVGEADFLWDALLHLTNPTSKMLKFSGFKLAFINDAIHSFLIDSMSVDMKKFKGSPKIWLDAVSAAATSDLLIGNGLS
ncbi:ATP-binding protein [Acidovorax sp. A1169]|uniref:ATP-binding protein n=1 Tax=Acidovorax sp. A1169 TaxID=3059524 RepID=UPI002737DEB1|nr:ATP-binding protein [Acidovorax sp. A1169]MDP4077043.1 ATP-binding protein [Acidovorax sp. A1169]